MKKKTIINFIHMNFLGGFFYAFAQFATTPRVSVLARRMWAYECWIIFGFYAIFLALMLKEKPKDERVLRVSLLKGKLRFQQSKSRND